MPPPTASRGDRMMFGNMLYCTAFKPRGRQVTVLPILLCPRFCTEVRASASVTSPGHACQAPVRTGSDWVTEAPSAGGRITATGSTGMLAWPAARAGLPWPILRVRVRPSLPGCGGPWPCPTGRRRGGRTSSTLCCSLGPRRPPPRPVRPSQPGLAAWPLARPAGAGGSCGYCHRRM